ncbi:MULTISPECIES: serine hydrolase domain-containing protein [Streptomyces]|uniref:Serine hydrolase domain-containing protein n=1 Tax=Streptomyces ramulosus TaxID=47762 RepID=A0ABW1FBX6_9ACTN
MPLPETTPPPPKTSGDAGPDGVRPRPARLGAAVRWTVVAAVAAALAVFAAGPRSAPVAAHRSGDATLAERVAGLLPDGRGAGGSVGVSVAVVDHDTVTRAALGTTDGSTPVTPDTAFETGSAQKVLTASLLGSLLDAGKIRLTDTVGALWPEYSFADPAVAGITVEQLATHTAGLPSFPADGPRFPLAMAGYLLGGNGYSLLQDPVRALAALTGSGPEPDTAFSYSNLGYAVLGETLAKVDGRDYPTALRERLLAPLGMDHTTVRTAPGTPDRAALPFHTAGTPVVPWTNPGWAAVGTGTWTTSADLAAFLAAGAAPNPPTALALTHTPHAAVADYADRDGHIGLGWQLWNAGGTTVSWHNGLTNGSRAFVAHTTDQRAVVVLTNSTRTPAEKIGFALLGVDAPEFDEPRTPHPVLLAATGLLTAGAPALALLGVVRPRRACISRPLDRLKAVSLPLTAATCWLLALRTGEWGHVPGVLCAIGAGLVTATAAESVRRWPALPTARGPYPWLRAVAFALPVLPLAVLFCTNAVITVDLP